jgi:hypothetical protein
VRFQRHLTVGRKGRRAPRRRAPAIMTHGTAATLDEAKAEFPAVGEKAS